ncbi:hypothetical protein [Polaromonas sp. YR568]|uniref:hypothetical protein n=1 Tax=Polaromonas sp. YR568 TaxID=1855301 RepID=UPI00398BC3B1
MQKKHFAAFALAAWALPWAAAQTMQSGSAPPEPPGLNPGAVQTPPAPLNNPLNRNPSRRALVPDNTPPPPPDPRDSSVRPVLPPGSFDSRDTVLPPPAPTASDARKP